MSPLRPLVDVALVARFELLRAVRTWRAVALVGAYLVATLGATWLVIQGIGSMEASMAEQLGVVATETPGAMLAELQRSEDLIDLLGDVFGDDALASHLARQPLLAVFAMWWGMGVAPFLAATAAAEAISIDLGTGALRFEATRTGRAELVAGRFVGQVVLLVAAVVVSWLGVWTLAATTMVQQDLVALAGALVWYGGRPVVVALPFVGLGVGLSQLTGSPALARVIALAVTTLSFLAYGVLSNTDHETLSILADATLPLFPQSWVTALWAGGPDALVGTVVCTALAGVAVVAGFVGLSRRDL